MTTAIAVTDEMAEAAARVLNKRLAEGNGLHGVSRDMLEAALAALTPHGEEAADPPPQTNLVGNGELRSAAMHLIGVLRANRRWINNSLAKDEIIAMDNAVEAVRAALASEGQADGR